MAEQTKTKLTLAQRTAANKQLEQDLIAAGFQAEAWTVTTGAKPGTGVNVSKGGRQFMRVTVNEAGFIKIRDYLKGTTQEQFDAIADAIGAAKDKFSLEVPRYGAQKFDLSRLG